MTSNSTPKPRRRKRADRPDKPYNEFPLYPHPSGSGRIKLAADFITSDAGGKSTAERCSVSMETAGIKHSNSTRRRRTIFTQVARPELRLMVSRLLIFAIVS